MKNSLLLVFLLIVSTIVPSCNKEESPVKKVYSLSTATKAQIDSAILADPDFKIISNFKIHISNRILSSTFSLNIDNIKSGSYLDSIHWNKNDYYQEVALVHQASIRLVDRFNLKNKTCSSCKINSLDEKIKKAVSIIDMMRKTPSAKEAFLFSGGNTSPIPIVNFSVDPKNIHPSNNSISMVTWGLSTKDQCDQAIWGACNALCLFTMETPITATLCYFLCYCNSCTGPRRDYICKPKF